MGTDRTRLPHAALEPAGRLGKAEKIFRLLDLPATEDRALRILEVGTGSGAIAQFFAEHYGRNAEVRAVDVVDQRIACDGVVFQLVEDARLPFDAGTFDAVISNHVIEHVGGRDEQVLHLREISRVLRDDGRGYLAVPSRWQTVEPHYGLAFLSWLPHSMRSGYLRMRGRGQFYDCEPLVARQVESYLSEAGLEFRNVFSAAIQAMAATERAPSIPARLAARLPARLLQALRVMSPTHIYLFAKHADALP